VNRPQAAERLSSLPDEETRRLALAFVVRHPRTVRNFRYAGVKKAVLSNDFNGRIQDALVLVRSPIC
jgi:hypothetical protein